MGQNDILLYLKKCKKPKTRKEIDKALKIQSSPSLQKLRKNGEVFWKIIKIEGNRNSYIYWGKR